MMDPSAPITATCESCDQTIAGNSGGIWIAMDDVREILRQIAQGGDHAAHDVGTWHVQHWTCAPGGAREDVYDIEIVALGAYWQYQERARDLGMKRWFRHTNWAELLHVEADDSVRLGRAA